MRRPTTIRGYILVEAMVAMVVLSLGILALRSAQQQTTLARGQARDYTQARFLLERLIAELEILPILREGASSGVFEGDFSRFRWSRTVSRVSLPGMEPPVQLLPGMMVQAPDAFVGKITATVFWTRSGQEFQETVETLVAPAKLPQAENEITLSPTS
ncbi:MAG: hypothetical protein HY706_21245 [Candidatus Hydrogenedentes bacterium]|nr:hypothetical protein [Candidatus Hydrogenedentota bacterium]